MTSFLLEAKLDPCNKHSHLSETDLIEWCGFIPNWLMTAISLADDPRSPTIGQAIEDSVLASYGFEVLDSMKMEPAAEILESGEYHYPEDPPLYPMVTFQHPAICVHVYPYGMVAFIHSGKTKMYRLD